MHYRYEKDYRATPFGIIILTIDSWFNKYITYYEYFTYESHFFHFLY